MSARERLAERQAELLGALVGGAHAPFDARGLRATATALAAKRARSVARVFPRLAAALGADFDARFAAHAASSALPAEQGPLADGAAFARALRREGALPDEAAPELLAVELRFAERAGGLARRRGPSVALALVRRPRRALLLALRVPGLGERWLAVPLPRVW